MTVHPYVRSGLMTLGVVVALGLFGLGFLTSNRGAGPNLPPEVERIAPEAEALVAPQGDIAVDLTDDQSGALLIDGREIPDFQLVRVDALGQLSFSPGPGKDVRTFTAGVHSATVVYWPKLRSRDDAHSFTWRFRVG